MACNQDGDANGIEILEHSHDLFGEFGIQISRGLIGKDQLRFVHNRASNPHTLLFAAGERHGQTFFLLKKPNLVERGANPPTYIVRMVARDMKRERNVFKDAAVIEQSVVLENQAQFAAKVRNLTMAELGNLNPIQNDVAPAGSLKCRNEAKERALSGTGMSGQKSQFTPFDAKADIREGFATLGIAFGDILKFDHAVVRPVGTPWKDASGAWYPLEWEKPKSVDPWEGPLWPLQ